MAVKLRPKERNGKLGCLNHLLPALTRTLFRNHDEVGNGDTSNEPIRHTQLRRDISTGTYGKKGSLSLYSPQRNNSLPAPTLQYRLSPSIEQHATHFFFKNFVLLPRKNDAARGFLEVAVPMFDRAKEDSPLYLATAAVAISVIANWPGRKHLAQLAARLYGRALSVTQKAIQDPKHSTSDATLLTVLLFSLYESITSTDHSVTAWAKHIDGAVAIAKVRGVKQFEHPQSLLLFRAVRTQMLTNAVQQQKAIEDFPGPKGWLSDMESDQSAAFNLMEFSISLPNLLSKAQVLLARGKSTENSAEVEALLEEAQEAQHALRNWEVYMPVEWAHRSVARFSGLIDPEKVEQAEVWPGPMHKYKDVHVSSIRNNSRVNEMLCSYVVIDALKWLHPEDHTHDERYCWAKNRVQTLVDEICYSVPFHLWGQDLGKKVRPDGQDQAGKNAIGHQTSDRANVTQPPKPLEATFSYGHFTQRQTCGV